MPDAAVGFLGFLDFLAEIVDLFPFSPSRRRKMNGPTVAAAAFAYGLLGVFGVVLGCGFLLSDGSSWIAGVISLCVGLALLTHVALGVTRFLKTS